VPPVDPVWLADGWAAPVAGSLAAGPVWRRADRVWPQVDPVFLLGDPGERRDDPGAPPGDRDVHSAGRGAAPDGLVCRQACRVEHSGDPVFPADRVGPVGRRGDPGEYSDDPGDCRDDPDARSRAADRRAGPDARPSD
jgi:hypothetical protein